MSKIYVQLTEFTNLNEDKSPGDISYGYRIYDDQTSEYYNLFSDIDELELNVNRDTVILFIKDNAASYYFDEIVEHGGLYLNDEWIEYKPI